MYTFALDAVDTALSMPAPVPRVSGVVVEPADLFSIEGRGLVVDSSLVRSWEGKGGEPEPGFPTCLLSCCCNFSMVCCILDSESVWDSYPKNFAMVVAFCSTSALAKLHKDEVTAEGQSACLVQKTAVESTGCVVHAIPFSPPKANLSSG
ncbi:hypothetical protein RRF57_008386 [Xylaria bambusicola]|uniref:Uncharacterized protein n=1 Tax=Xylaria bambusicola TaxID=326684 RepID=A0AAN7Z702_9PEZI